LGVDVDAGAVEFGEGDGAAADGGVDFIHDAGDFHHLSGAGGFEPLAIGGEVAAEEGDFRAAGRGAHAVAGLRHVELFWIGEAFEVIK
jgi:hypothetical protein